MSLAGQIPGSTWLGGILRVSRDEWPKALQFAGLGLLLQLGLGLGFSAGDAAFLVNVGADSLPLIFLLTPAVMLMVTPAMAWVISHVGLEKTCMSMMALLALIGAMIFLLLGPLGVTASWLYGFIKLYLAALYISLYSLYWLFVDDYYSVDDGKRLYPLFAVGSSVGTAIGAFSVSALAPVLGSGAFFLIWAVVALCTVPAIHRIARRWRKISDQSARPVDQDDGQGFLKQQGAVVRSLASSRFATAMALMLFLTLFITNISEYQYSAIFSQGRSEAELASLLGRLYGIFHVVNIGICLFAFNPLVRHLGVKNVALILPIAYFATFLLLFVNTGFIAAAVAFGTYHSVLTAIEYNNQNLLFNALPAQTRRELRTLIEGLCEPFASCAAGLFLLALQENWGLRQVAGMTLLVAALLLWAALQVRNAYPAAMSRNMRLGWLDLGGARRLRLAPDEDTVRLLVKAASEPASPIARDALEMLIEMAPARAAAPLVAAVRSWPVEWEDRLEALLRQLLARCDEATFLTLTAELTALDATGNRIARGQLSRLALPLGLDGSEGSAAFRERLRRLRAEEGSVRAAALAEIDTLLRASVQERRAALEMLSLLRVEGFSKAIIRMLDDPESQVRVAALHALRHLGRSEGRAIADALLSHIPRAAQGERRLALEILHDCADLDHHERLLALVPHLSPQEAREVEAILGDFGRLAVVSLVAALTNRRLSHASRTTAARALARASFKHLDELHERLIAEELDETAGCSQRIALLEAHPEETELLRAYYREHLRSGVDFVLELLALVQVLPNVDLITASLHSANPKDRANALETINSAVDARTFARIGAALGASSAVDLAAERAQRNSSHVLAILEHTITDGDAFESAAAADALAMLDPGRLSPALRTRLADGGDVRLFADLAGATPAVRLASLRQARSRPELAGAKLSTLLALAEATLASTGSDDALVDVPNTVARRYPDLALSMFTNRAVAL